MIKMYAETAIIGGGRAFDFLSQRDKNTLIRRQGRIQAKRGDGTLPKTK